MANFAQSKYLPPLRPNRLKGVISLHEDEISVHPGEEVLGAFDAAICKVTGHYGIPCTKAYLQTKQLRPFDVGLHVAASLTVIKAKCAVKF